ncbi:MAG: hypothetical protein EON55_12830 [Alphaproteobacteria bacterium]|jgi:hypothetical protein|nr:MAG: hypothetical protein EON55_12830 [Alphaproteobacteria bacterium]
MVHYRLYILGRYGRIAKAFDLHHPDDDHALAATDQHSHSYGMELWSGVRKVQHFPAPKEAGR